jgi:phosphatidylinositol alpha 1,6-mannosyltransferase
MRLLWAVGNWKRTGPVEPSLDLAAALARRGHEVLVVTGRVEGDAADEVAEAAEARGLPRLGLGLSLARHLAPVGNLLDARRLAPFIRSTRPGLVVSTLRNDHRVLARAAARAGTGVPLARLWFEDGSSPPERSERALLAAAARVVVFGEAARQALVPAGVAAGAVVVVPPPLDVARVRRGATRSAEARERWAAGGEALFGVVARVQPHRRFELLWDAAAGLRKGGTPFRVLVVGRGTRLESLVTEPVAARGLDGTVAHAGYLRGDDYASTLAALDAIVFLVPGSDPTCRALREAMALGVPAVATRRGLLPDLVRDGVTGLLVDEDAGALEAALSRLASDPALRARLGAAAAARADAEFDLARVAARVEAAFAEVA